MTVSGLGDLNFWRYLPLLVNYTNRSTRICGSSACVFFICSLHEATTLLQWNIGRLRRLYSTNHLESLLNIDKSQEYPGIPQVLRVFSLRITSHTICRSKPKSYQFYTVWPYVRPSITCSSLLLYHANVSDGYIQFPPCVFQYPFSFLSELYAL